MIHTDGVLHYRKVNNILHNISHTKHFYPIVSYWFFRIFNLVLTKLSNNLNNHLTNPPASTNCGTIQHTV